MSNPRWVIFFMTAFILFSILGNIVEGADIFTSGQVANIKELQEAGTVAQAADPTVGGVVTYGNLLMTMVTGLYKAITMQYSWLYDVNPTTHVKTPNEYFWIWAVLWWPIVIGLVFSLTLELARLVRGTG